MRVWDTASGREVKQVSGADIVFDAGKPTTNAHLTLWLDKLVITKMVAHGGVMAIQDDAAPVACFKPPQQISCVLSNSETICVGCCGGAVCILRAPFRNV